MPSSSRPADTVAGIALVVALVFAESVPLGGRIADAPELFTVQFFLPRSLGPWSIGWLLVPAGAAFALALAPAVRRGPPRRGHVVLVALGLSFFPLVAVLRPWVRHPYVHEGPDALLWSLLVFLWAGLVLWVRRPDYLWSSAAASTLWDLGAAVRGLARDVARIGVPYFPGLAPRWVIAIDVVLCAACVALWTARFDPFPWIDRATSWAARRRARA